MERSESRAVLSDAEPDSDCPKDPLDFGREPANLKPRSRAGLTGPRGRYNPMRSFPSFRFQAAWRPNAAPARTGPPPHRLRLVTQELGARPLPTLLTIVDLRLSAALAAQAAP